MLIKGVGQDTKSPSDHVVEMRIFDHEGNLQTYDKPAVLKAASANFGCFGIIFDVTIKLEPGIVVKTENCYEPLTKIFESTKNMKDLIENNWSVEIFWFPFNSGCFTQIDKDQLWIRVINETDETHVENAWFYQRQDKKDLLSQEALAIASPFIAENPGITPLYAYTAFKFLKDVINPKRHLIQELPHAIHFRNHIHKAPVYDMEFAFAVGNDKKDYENMIAIIEVVTRKVTESAKDGKYPLNVALEMRWMGHSDSLLCPAIIGQKSRRVLYIEVLSVVGTKEWEEFCIDVGTEWMNLGGVPHFAKQWEFLPDIVEHCHEKMGQHIRKFREVLEKSGADPKGMFMNKKLEELIFYE